MTDIGKNRPDLPKPEPGPEKEESPAARRRAISGAMMQALEDDMDRRPEVYRRLADS